MAVHIEAMCRCGSPTYGCVVESHRVTHESQVGSVWQGSVVESCSPVHVWSVSQSFVSLHGTIIIKDFNKLSAIAISSHKWVSIL